MLRVTELKVITNDTEHLGRVGLELNCEKGRIRFITNTEVG